MLHSELAMARRPTYSKTSVKRQVEKLERKCRFCKTHRNAIGFDKHEAWCKKTWIIRRELQELRTHSMTNCPPAEASLSSLTYSDVNHEFVQGCSSMEVEYSELDPQNDIVMTQSHGRRTSLSELEMFTQKIADPVGTFGPNLPREYIKIIPHPHSPNPTAKIIVLGATNSVTSCYTPQLDPHSWAPFKNLADFEYAETAVLGLLPKWIVDKQLAGLNSNWAEKSHVTFKNFTEMEKALSSARKYFVQVSRNHLPSSLLHYSRCS